MDLHTFAEELDRMLSSEEFLAKREELTARLDGRFESFFRNMDSAIDELQSSDAALPLSLLEALPRALVAQWRDLGPDVRSVVAKELVARRLTRLPAFIKRAKLPLSIIGQYPTAVRYMISSIVSDPSASYGNEGSHFDRDLRLASGFTLPAGAEVVDLRCWLPKNFYRFQGLKENLRCLSFVMFRLGGLGPLFRMHLDSRHLEDFNPTGRNRCFARIADLLEAMPEVRGLVGTSWFYDPQLEKISPNLQYLRTVPMEGGAFLRIDGPGEIHTQRATARSQTRRRLYEEGRYSPVCATLVWPRKDLVSWSKATMPNHRW
jgi:hypothetical protein